MITTDLGNGKIEKRITQREFATMNRNQFNFTVEMLEYKIHTWVFGSMNNVENREIYQEKHTGDVVCVDTLIEWSPKDSDPKQDLKNALNREPDYEPHAMMVNTDQSIKLHALEMFAEWKRKWRKEHPILSFFERVWNKIRGVKDGF